MTEIPTVRIWYQVKTSNGSWSDIRYHAIDTYEELDRCMKLLDSGDYNLCEMVDTSYEEFNEEEISKKLDAVSYDDFNMNKFINYYNM